MLSPIACLRALCLVIALAIPAAAWADAAPFDLAGPDLRVQVTHAGKTLPIAQVPNLSAGDQLSIQASLSADQSAPYLLVAAFLRGATNPPPKNWFFRAETWTPEGRAGLKITVPQGAQQALIFLAPRTGGDFGTLVSAVRGRPGAFVRAAQDLDQTSWDRTRLNAFLAAVSLDAQSDPTQLAAVSPLLARSLAIKLNADCLQKLPSLQGACLLENRESLVLQDGHADSMAQTLTSGTTSELVQDLSATPKAGFGYYSAYVAVVMDMVRVMNTLNTANYQYIPALGGADGDKLALTLNAAPSFHAPLSVLVAALPPVGPPQPPSLKAVDPKTTYCAQAPSLLIPLDGAPLAYSTGYAHDLVLRLKADGRQVDLPAKLDATKGGLVVDNDGLKDAHLGGATDAALHGQWGFGAFDGPKFQVQSAQPEHWALAPADADALIAGHEVTAHLVAADTACVKAVSLRGASGDDQPVTWTRSKADELTLTLPLKQAQPGAVTLLVKQYGLPADDTAPVRIYAEPSRLDGFELHSGEPSGVLTGTRLGQVASLAFHGLTFTPGSLVSVKGADTLPMAASDQAAAIALKAGDAGLAKVTLADGRTLTLPASVQTPRPSIALIDGSLRIEASPHAGVDLTDPAEAPAGSTLTFAVRAQAPKAFRGDESLEVATVDGVSASTLTFAKGLVLQDAQVAVASLDTGKALGASAFGPLQFRIVSGGVDGGWLPLATLVRLPTLAKLQCSKRAEQPCQLKGSNLFLIAAIAADRSFDHATPVPDGFTGGALKVPRPVGGRLYLKLRDAPSIVNVMQAGGPAPVAVR